MSRELIVPIKLGLKGEYRAVVHKGDGVPIRETAWGKNIITGVGLNEVFTYQNQGYCVAGNGNSTPSLSDTVLDSYLGKMSTIVSRQLSINNDPGAGQLFVSTLVRAQFNAGAFGGSPVNIAEAGFTTGTDDLNFVDATTPLFSRGLLVDGFGNPTAVAVQPDEYLDIYWRFTVNIPYNTTGTFDLDIDGVPTPIDYQVRPLKLVPVAGLGSAPWSGVAGGALPYTLASVYMPNALGGTTLAAEIGASDSALVAPSADIGLDIPDRASTGTYAAYTSGDYYRDFTLVWALSRGNFTGGIDTFVVYMGYTKWQLAVDPPIMKDDNRQLSVTFRLAAENTP